MTNSSKWLVFALVAAAQFMVVLDISVTNVALPTIKATLGFTSTSALQWVVTAYSLGFGGFLLFGGRAADLFGRRNTLLGGMAAFTLFSFLIGISQSGVLLIILRALQGLSAAFMSPAALSIVLTTFDEGPSRNQALGFWSLIATGGAAVGLLLGGFLTQYVGWRWDFFINVPVGILILFLVYRFVPKHEQEESDQTLDIPGAVLVTGGLIALVFAISEASVSGLTSFVTLGSALVGFGLLALFVHNEAKVRHPLMPLHIFAVRNVVAANLMMAPMMACMLGVFFLISLYIQNVLNYPPALSGLSFLPFPLVLGVIASNVPKYVSRWGFKRFLIMGPVFVGLAVLWLARIPLDGSYFFDLLPAFILMPIGMGMTFMPIVVAATSGVPPQEAGLASGLITTSQQMGGALGLAILSGIATSAAAGSRTPAAAVLGAHYAFLTGTLFIIFALFIAVFALKQPARSVH